MGKQVSFPDNLAGPAPRKVDFIMGHGMEARGDIFLLESIQLKMLQLSSLN